MGHNREGGNGALLKSIMGIFKSIIGSSLMPKRPLSAWPRVYSDDSNVQNAPQFWYDSSAVNQTQMEGRESIQVGSL